MEEVIHDSSHSALASPNLFLIHFLSQRSVSNRYDRQAEGWSHPIGTRYLSETNHAGYYIKIIVKIKAGRRENEAAWFTSNTKNFYHYSFFFQSQKMISRRRILSRSRDDLTTDPSYQVEEEEDVWYQKDKLFKVSFFFNLNFRIRHSRIRMRSGESEADLPSSACFFLIDC